MKIELPKTILRIGQGFLFSGLVVGSTLLPVVSTAQQDAIDFTDYEDQATEITSKISAGKLVSAQLEISDTQAVDVYRFTIGEENQSQLEEFSVEIYIPISANVNAMPALGLIRPAANEEFITPPPESFRVQNLLVPQYYDRQFAIPTPEQVTTERIASLGEQTQKFSAEFSAPAGLGEYYLVVLSDRDFTQPLRYALGFNGETGTSNPVELSQFKLDFNRTSDFNVSSFGARTLQVIGVVIAAGGLSMLILDPTILRDRFGSIRLILNSAGIVFVSLGLLVYGLRGLFFGRDQLVSAILAVMFLVTFFQYLGQQGTKGKPYVGWGTYLQLGLWWLLVLLVIY